MYDGEFKEAPEDDEKALEENAFAGSNAVTELSNSAQRYLRVLLIREILSVLLKFLDPQNAVEFLSIHPAATFDSTGWIIMRRSLGIGNIEFLRNISDQMELREENPGKTGKSRDEGNAGYLPEKVDKSLANTLEDEAIVYKDDRDFVLHIIRKYGFCCTDCFKLLEGKNGFFCCTSLCKDCSEERFKGQEYVDSTVRFYLCGEESLTGKSQAALAER